MPILTQTVLTWSLVPVAVAIAAAPAVAPPKPTEAQVAEGAPEVGSDRSAVYLAQCLLDWGAGTHMTKQEWSAHASAWCASAVIS